MVAFRPGHQRPQRARNLLLLLLAAILLCLGGSMLLWQEPAVRSGQKARQTDSTGSSGSSSEALQRQVDDLRREKAALEAQLAELRQQVQQRSGASTGAAQVGTRRRLAADLHPCTGRRCAALHSCSLATQMHRKPATAAGQRLSCGSSSCRAWQRLLA